MTKLGRRPLQIIEIDQDYCTRTYGAAPCAAVLGTTGAHKCFNTYRTCQDQTNYGRGTKTLRFARSQDGLPKGMTVFPALRNVSTNPTVINVGGTDNNTAPLGRRASVTVTLNDFTYHDRYLDKYAGQRSTGAAQADGVGYNPAERSTFWTKWRQRNPYYQGRALRVLEGYVGQPLGEMKTRHYIIEKVVGPDTRGNVTITAKDVLALADDKRAVAPKANSGALSAAITAAATSFTLTPAGIGDAEYATSGVGRIGEELVTFTRSSDTVTITRGQHGTIAEDHSAGDRFQTALVFNGTLVSDVLYSLLVNYGNVSAGFIDKAAWDAEAIDFLSGFKLTALIPEPTGVQKLIGEVCTLGPYLWWDEVAQKIRMQANRPPQAVTVKLTEGRHIVAGSTEVTDKPEQRITAVILRFAPIDLSKGADDAANYRQWIVNVDGAASGPNEYGDQRIHAVNSRWLPPGSKGVALQISDRIISRYRDTPRLIGFEMDAKDRDIWTGTVCDIVSRHDVDETGAPVAHRWQIISAEEIEAGHKSRYIAQSYDWTPRNSDGGSSDETVIIISDSAQNINLRSLYDSLYAVITPKVKFVIEAPVVIGASDATTIALDTGAWPSETILRLENNGRIQGAGGAGGIGGTADSGTTTAGAAGGNGGDAVNIRRAITISNPGKIWAGGGGGGGGGAYSVYESFALIYISEGGGGGGGAAGIANGSGGAGGVANGSGSDSLTSGAPGANGTADAGGAGGDGGGNTAGNGGAAGGPGAAGSAGASVSGGSAGGAGGAGGYYVRGNANVTWETLGDRRGSVG